MAKQGECAQCGEVGPLRTGLCFRDYGMKWSVSALSLCLRNCETPSTLK